MHMMTETLIIEKHLMSRIGCVRVCVFVSNLGNPMPSSFVVSSRKLKEKGVHLRNFPFGGSFDDYKTKSFPFLNCLWVCVGLYIYIFFLFFNGCVFI